MRFEEIKAKLSQYKVGIAGCGGLGSNCAQMLVRTGITKLVIADFDVVSESNLNRQFFFADQIGRKKVNALKENLSRISPVIEIETHSVYLTPDIVKEIYVSCDAIVEAFDNKENKWMLIETVEKYFPDKLLVSASGLAGLNKIEQMKIVRNGLLVMVGDFEEEVSDDNPPLAPKVMMAAALEAAEVINYLLNKP